MRIPEDPKGMCIWLAKQGKYNEVLDYLLTCDFYLIRFIGDNEYFVDNCTKYNIWINNASNFNDKFDCCWKMPEDTSNLLKLANMNKHDWKNYAGSTMKICSRMVKDHIFISCFSDHENISNSRMWYMYAGQYKGACLVYKIKDIANTIMTFNENKRHNDIFFGFPKTAAVLPVSYSKEHGMLQRHAEESTYSAISTKAKCWEDEKEWRWYYFDLEINDGFLLKCVPDKIILGPEISEENKRNIVEKSKVPVYQSYFDYYSLRIEIEEKILNENNIKRN